MSAELLEAWQLWDAQCERRKGVSDLPTAELTHRVETAMGELAAGIGVTTTELREWLVALRRGGWSHRAAVESVGNLRREETDR